MQVGNGNAYICKGRVSEYVVIAERLLNASRGVRLESGKNLPRGRIGCRVLCRSASGSFGRDHSLYMSSLERREKFRQALLEASLTDAWCLGSSSPMCCINNSGLTSIFGGGRFSPRKMGSSQKTDNLLFLLNPC